MSKAPYQSDEIITNDAIHAIHQRLVKGDIYTAMAELLSHETALYAYVIYCGHDISDFAESIGIPPHAVKRINEEVMR